MVTLLHLVGWAVGLLAAAGVAAALALLAFPRLRAAPAAFVERHLFPDANQIVLNKAKAAARGQRPTYRVLAFGDSLTEGFSQGGIILHPYAKRLGDLLYAQLPQGWHLEVEEQGESGERVLISMKHRLQRTLDEHATAARHYDWVLLLGGINDLAGDGSTADEVLAGLAGLAEACLAHGASVCLMTLLEVAEPEPRVEEQRQRLNGLIRDYVASQRWQGAASSSAGAAAAGAAGGQQQQQQQDARWRRRGPPRIVLLDLERALPWRGMDEEQRWLVWDDGVHLTMQGYDQMGAIIADALAPLVKRELAAHAAAADGAQPAAADKKAQ